MSGKLDQALDDIVKTRRGRPARRARGVKKTAGPSGGVSKNQKAQAKAAPTAPAPKAAGQGKIIVSNLPSDVSEAQIKEFFTSSVGPIKTVTLTYGPNGVSRGVATIVFRAADAAQKALRDVNGLQIDKRPLKVEVVYDAKSAPGAPTAKPLTERVTQNKNTPKANPKNAPKSAAAPAKGAAATRGKGKGRQPRRKPATKEQLDAEMTDYFGGEQAAPAAPAATEMKMDEEVL